jgi:hypothetical protein
MGLSEFEGKTTPPLTIHPVVYHNFLVGGLEQFYFFIYWE